MNVQRFCRTKATTIQFVVLGTMMMYLVYQLKMIENRKKAMFPSKEFKFKEVGGPDHAAKGDEVNWKSVDENSIETVGGISLQDRIRASRDYILRQVNTDGSFIYRINMDPSKKLKPDYNLLRHAGTIYSLAMIDEIFPKDAITEKMHSAMVSTAMWLQNHIGPIDDPDHRNDVYVLWSPKIEYKKGPAETKLGGAGLGLTALLKTRRIDEKVLDLEEAEKVGNFIDFMQHEDGSFDCKWQRGKGRVDFVSLYYPGEATLGLSTLYAETENPKWLRVALKAIKYLASTRKDIPIMKVLPDHWALIATRELLKVSTISAEDREIIIDHAYRVSSKLISEQKSSDIKGIDTKHSFDHRGGLSPACTRLEGLLAFAIAMKDEPQKLPSGMRQTIDNGMKFVFRNQEMADNKYKGAFRKQTYPDEGNDHLEVRIDNVQHCVTAMVKYYEFLTTTAKSRS